VAFCQRRGGRVSGRGWGWACYGGPIVLSLWLYASRQWQGVPFFCIVLSLREPAVE
jgi:hypothetical protein